jgi:hypothetical protein
MYSVQTFSRNPFGFVGCWVFDSYHQDREAAVERVKLLERGHYDARLIETNGRIVDAEDL